MRAPTLPSNALRLALVCLTLLLLTAAGVGVRAGHLARTGVRTNQALGFDSYQYYVSAAESLLAGRGLDPAYNHRTPAPPAYVPPPLQSVFVAAVYRLRGAHDLFSIYHTQIALNLAAGLIAFFIMLEWSGLAAALAAYAGWMLYPEFAYWVSVPMAESNYFLLMLLGLWVLTRWGKALSLPWAVAGAAMIGLANLQRPSALYLGLALAPLALLMVPGRKKWLHALVFLLVPFAVLTPWMVRNKRLTGDPVWVSSNGGILLYAVNNPGYDPLKYPDYGKTPAVTWLNPAVEKRFWSKELAGHRTYHRLSALYQAEAEKYILAHPLHFAKNFAIKLVQRFTLVPASLQKFYPGLAGWGVALLFYPLLLLGLAGLVATPAAWCHPTRRVLACCFAYYTFFVSLMHYLGDGRLNLTLKVFLLLFGAWLVGALLQKFLPRRPAQDFTESPEQKKASEQVESPSRSAPPEAVV